MYPVERIIYYLLCVPVHLSFPDAINKELKCITDIMKTNLFL